MRLILQVKMKLTSQLIKGISRVLLKLLKYFKDTVLLFQDFLYYYHQEFFLLF